VEPAIVGHILVVHDDPAFTRAMRRLLRDGGYAVSECHAAEDAILSILRGEEYDLILIDVPARRDGATHLYERLAAMEAELAPRIVFFAEPEVELPGTNPRIVKPISAEDLCSWITEFVDRRTRPPRSPVEPLAERPRS